MVWQTLRREDLLVLLGKTQDLTGHIANHGTDDTGEQNLIQHNVVKPTRSADFQFLSVPRWFSARLTTPKWRHLHCDMDDRVS